MKIEFIKAYEDGTWSTEVIDVPNEVTKEVIIDDTGGTRVVEQQMDHSSPHWDAAIINWCHNKLYTQTQYRKVVYWGIYNSDPEQGEEEDGG